MALPGGEIICTCFCNGRRHDFRMFKESGLRLPEEIQTITDTGYLGLARLHKNALLQKKRGRKTPLTKADKQFNKSVSSRRILNEQVIGWLKRFKIIAERYRNRRKRFGLRFNLIAGI